MMFCYSRIHLEGRRHPHRQLDRHAQPKNFRAAPPYIGKVWLEAANSCSDHLMLTARCNPPFSSPYTRAAFAKACRTPLSPTSSPPPPTSRPACKQSRQVKILYNNEFFNFPATCKRRLRVCDYAIVKEQPVVKEALGPSCPAC